MGREGIGHWPDIPGQIKTARDYMGAFLFCFYTNEFMLFILLSLFHSTVSAGYPCMPFYLTLWVLFHNLSEPPMIWSWFYSTSPELICWELGPRCGSIERVCDLRNVRVSGKSQVIGVTVAEAIEVVFTDPRVSALERVMKRTSLEPGKVTHACSPCYSRG